MPQLKWLRHRDLAIVRRGEILPRETFLDVMTFRGGPTPLTEIFGPLLGLKEAWEEQGATPEELDFSAFHYRFPVLHSIKACTGRLGAFEREVGENDEAVFFRDDLGRDLEMLKGVASIPHPLNDPVASMDDWLKLKPRYQFSPERFAPDWLEQARAARGRGEVLTLGIPGGFDEPRQLLGNGGVCLACYDQPELLRDIVDTIAETAEDVIRHVTREIPLDMLRIHEDMAGKSGPLWGPDEIVAFMQSYYRRAWDAARQGGARLFDLDSDGYVDPILETLIDSGVNCIHPMEPAAGMDIVGVRARFGSRLAMIGGLDKFALTRGRAAIDRELDTKMPPLIRSGGIMFGLDHRIPAEVPLADYRYYLERAWSIIRREEAKR